VSDRPPVIAANFNGELTQEQLAELGKRWLAIVTSPQPCRCRWLYKGRWRHALPLPWNTRLRLWCDRRRDAVAIWLVYRDHFAAAEAAWRLTGAWRRRAR
jgi:hypothetical protein